MWLFFKKPATRRKSAPFKKELLAFACVIATFFLTLSLVSFDASDQTFLYYSSVAKPIHNWCGIAGAYAAAFVLYMMGSAWVLAIFILLFIAYLLFNQRTLAAESFRLLCCGLLVLSGSTLLWCSGWDPWYPAVPGGWFGFFFGQLLHRWCNPIGTVIIALMVACLCLMVITRVSMRFIVHAGYTVGVSACSSLYALARMLIKPVFSKDKKSSVSTSQNISFKGSSRESYSLNMADLLETRVPEKKSAPKQPIAPKPTAAPPGNSEADADPTSYQMPSIDMFMGVNEEQYDQALMQELERRAILLQEKLERFDIYGKVTAIKRGPIITLFEYQPDIDTKISKIVALEDDLALALQTTSIRIMAPIPGTSVVGFEVANRQRRNVFLSTLVKTEHYTHTKATLPLLLGVDTIGSPVIIDLCKMPHLLMAGSTGSGKSVTLNAMIISLLCKASPDDVRLILIDPKRLEFAGYGDIAHLLFPIVTDPKQAAPVLRWVVKQMEERYALLAQAQARTIFDYRAKGRKRRPTAIALYCGSH